MGRQWESIARVDSWTDAKAGVTFLKANGYKQADTWPLCGGWAIYVRGSMASTIEALALIRAWRLAYRRWDGSTLTTHRDHGSQDGTTARQLASPDADPRPVVPNPKAKGGAPMTSLEQLFSTISQAKADAKSSGVRIAVVHLPDDEDGEEWGYAPLSHVDQIFHKATVIGYAEADGSYHQKDGV